jgi:hypothetical protein
LNLDDLIGERRIMRPSLLGLRVCCTVAAVLLLPAGVAANVGERWWGDHAGKPSGLVDVVITREDLAIDLRPLADLRPAIVEATYHLSSGTSCRQATRGSTAHSHPTWRAAAEGHRACRSPAGRTRIAAGHEIGLPMGLPTTRTRMLAGPTQG